MEEQLNTKQAADFLGFQPSTLKRWRRLGKGPKFTRPVASPAGKGKVLYRKSDLMKFMGVNIND